MFHLHRDENNIYLFTFFQLKKYKNSLVNKITNTYSRMFTI